LQRKVQFIRKNIKIWKPCSYSFFHQEWLVRSAGASSSSAEAAVLVDRALFFSYFVTGNNNSAPVALLLLQPLWGFFNEAAGDQLLWKKLDMATLVDLCTIFCFTVYWSQSYAKVEGQNTHYAGIHNRRHYQHISR
jgi:hypothetical protein